MQLRQFSCNMKNKVSVLSKSFPQGLDFSHQYMFTKKIGLQLLHGKAIRD